MRIFISTITIFLLTITTNFGQKNINQVLRKYKNDTGVINLNFTGESLKQFAEAKKTIKSTIDNVDILVFETKADVTASDKTQIKGVLTRDNFESIIDVKHKDGKVKVMAVDAGPHLTQLYAQLTSDKMNVYIIATGKIIFEELSDLGLNFSDTAGIDLLKKYSGK